MRWLHPWASPVPSSLVPAALFEPDREEPGPATDWIRLRVNKLYDERGPIGRSLQSLLVECG